MKTIKIWIDADSCPRRVREYVIAKASSWPLKVTFVANRNIPQKACPGTLDMVVCGKEKGAADDVIVQNAVPGDVVVTRDVPLAQRLVQKRVCVMNDRGVLFTDYNIAEKLRERDFNLQLAQIGFGGHSSPSYSGKELQLFAQCFDREVKRILLVTDYL